MADYKRADRQLGRVEVRRGVVIDAFLYVVIMTGLLIVNLTVADQFPWVVFPLVGWGIGLTLQYVLGLRWVSRSIVERQVMVEELAAATKRRTGGAQAGHPPPG